MAHSYNNLQQKMIDRDNIVAAILAAAKGKRAKRSVKRALADIDKTADFVRDLIENDKVFVRAVRSAGRMIKKAEEGRRVTAYDAQKIISYFGRFVAFESGNAFFNSVCRAGKIGLGRMRQKVSAWDRIRNRRVA